MVGRSWTVAALGFSVALGASVDEPPPDPGEGPCHVGDGDGDPGGDGDGDGEPGGPPPSEALADEIGLPTLAPDGCVATPGWETHCPSGTSYRRPSSRERRALGLTRRDWFVASARFESELSGGSSAPLAVPGLLPTAPERVVVLEFAGPERLEHVVFGAGDRSYRPAFWRTTARSRGKNVASAFARADGGSVAAQGSIGGTSFALRPIRAELELPTPVGATPLLASIAERDFGGQADIPDSVCPAAGCERAAECDDGLDNDGDDRVDDCDFSCVSHPDFGWELFDGADASRESGRELALVGDGVFCERQPEDWDTLLMMFGMEGTALLGEVDPDLPRHQLVAAFCWTGFQSLDEAVACQFATDAPDGVRDDDNADYPLRGLPVDNSSQTLKIYEGGWQMLELLMTDAGLVGPPVHQVGVVWGDGSSIFGDLGPADGYGFVDQGTSSHQLRGAFVVKDPSIVATRCRLAHELAHTVGLDHDNLVVDGERGILHQNGGCRPEFGEIVVSQRPGFWNQLQFDNATLWAEAFLDDYGRPRPPGFAFTGCESDAQCNTGSLAGHVCDGNGKCERN